MRRATAALVLGLWALALTACGDGEDPGTTPEPTATEMASPTPVTDPTATATAEPPDPTATAAPTAAPTATPVERPGYEPSTGGDFERLLGFVPDAPEYRLAIRMNDLGAARDALGITAPGPDASAEELENQKLQLFWGGDPDAGDPFATMLMFGEDWLSGFHRYMGMAPDTYTYLGFDTRNVEQSLAAGRVDQHPTPLIDLVTGQFSHETAATLLADCEECVPHEVGEHAGVEFYMWGEEMSGSLADRYSPPLHDGLGRGGRLLITDDYAARTLRDQPMFDLIDTQEAGASTLAADDDFRLAARTLSDLGAVSGTFTDLSFRLPDLIEFQVANSGRIQAVEAPEMQATVADAMASTLPMPEFSIAASGIGRDGGGVYAALVLVFPDDAAAEDAAAALADRIENWTFPLFSTPDGTGTVPWTDVIIESEIASSGRTATARLYAPDHPDVLETPLTLDVEAGLYGFTAYLVAYR